MLAAATATTAAAAHAALREISVVCAGCISLDATNRSVSEDALRQLCRATDGVVVQPFRHRTPRAPSLRRPNSPMRAAPNGIVPHRQVVLTIPKRLRAYCLYRRRLLGATDAVLLDGGISAQLMLRDSTGTAHRWPGTRRVPLGLVVYPR